MAKDQQNCANDNEPAWVVLERSPEEIKEAKFSRLAALSRQFGWAGHAAGSLPEDLNGEIDWSGIDLNRGFLRVIEP